VTTSSKSLRAWRTERLLSTRRLAALAGASNKTIVQIEHGRQTPSLVTIQKISRALEIEPRDVIEFAMAINSHAGMAVLDIPQAAPVDAPRPHVCCISGPTRFPVLARQMLENERYGVTSVVNVTLSAAQIACLKPDLLILDIDAGQEYAQALLRDLADERTTDALPVVVTGRDALRADALVAEFGVDTRLTVVATAADSDLRDLVATVNALLQSRATSPA
jgi:transcriptional regulator with XRE-family HTH domain